MTALGRKADIQPGRMSALTDTGRSEDLRLSRLNGSFRPMPDAAKIKAVLAIPAASRCRKAVPGSHDLALLSRRTDSLNLHPPDDPYIFGPLDSDLKLPFPRMPFTTSVLMPNWSMAAAAASELTSRASRLILSKVSQAS